MSRNSRILEAHAKGMSGLIAAATGGTYRAGENVDVFGNPHYSNTDTCLCWQCPKWDGVTWWQPKPLAPFSYGERRRYGLVKRASGGVMFKDESEA